MNTDQALPEAQRHYSSDADVVLEAGDHVGHTWRSRWTSLTLFTRAE